MSKGIQDVMIAKVVYRFPAAMFMGYSTFQLELEHETMHLTAVAEKGRSRRDWRGHGYNSNSKIL